MINSSQLRKLIIKPTLLDLVMYSEDAEELLIFTLANESNGGTFLSQINGCAVGIYQMEPSTHTDIWVNFIPYHNDILLRLTHSFDVIRMPPIERLIYDLRYATAMTRIHYERVKEALPSKNNVTLIWEYYKTYYNTALGRADQRSAIMKYQEFKNN